MKPPPEWCGKDSITAVCIILWNSTFFCRSSYDVSHSQTATLVLLCLEIFVGYKAALHILLDKCANLQCSRWPYFSLPLISLPFSTSCSMMSNFYTHWSGHLITIWWLYHLNRLRWVPALRSSKVEKSGNQLISGLISFVWLWETSRELLLSGLTLVLSKVPHKFPIKLLHKNKVKLGTVQLAVL